MMPTMTELRAAARRLLYDDCRDPADHDALVAFIDDVERDRKRFRWISVKEALPPSNRKVLLYTDRGAVFRGYYDHVHQCWRTTKTVNITHWRAMPDGPEEVEEDD